MNTLDQELTARLEDIRAQELYRELKQIESPQSSRVLIGGRELLNFSSNDYLGLANAPELKAAAVEAVGRYGAGSGGSRLICGSLSPHHQLEEGLAEFKGSEAALTFNTGYAAALGTVGALMGKDDVVIIDKLVHACIVDAARLAGATLRVFKHNDLNDLIEILRWADRPSRTGGSNAKRPNVLIVTESVFSMDGDHAPLRALVELKEKFGAWLMVDEAHATGLYGQSQRGLAEQEEVGGRIEIQMGTLGKAVGASGGYICGSRKLIDYLINRARSFIFSTAPVPAAVGAATAGIQLIRSRAGAGRCQALWERVGQFKAATGANNGASTSAIIPVILGDEGKALSAARQLMEQGMYVPAVRYPTVARGKARLRITLTAAHSREDVARLLSAREALELPQPEYRD